MSHNNNTTNRRQRSNSGNNASTTSEEEDFPTAVVGVSSINNNRNNTTSRRTNRNINNNNRQQGFDAIADVERQIEQLNQILGTGGRGRGRSNTTEDVPPRTYDDEDDQVSSSSSSSDGLQDDAYRVPGEENTDAPSNDLAGLAIREHFRRMAEQRRTTTTNNTTTTAAGNAGATPSTQSQQQSRHQDPSSSALAAMFQSISTSSNNQGATSSSSSSNYSNLPINLPSMMMTRSSNTTTSANSAENRSQLNALLMESLMMHQSSRDTSNVGATSSANNNNNNVDLSLMNTEHQGSNSWSADATFVPPPRTISWGHDHLWCCLLDPPNNWVAYTSENQLMIDSAFMEMEEVGAANEEEEADENTKSLNQDDDEDQIPPTSPSSQQEEASTTETKTRHRRRANRQANISMYDQTFQILFDEMVQVNPSTGSKRTVVMLNNCQDASMIPFVTDTNQLLTLSRQLGGYCCPLSDAVDARLCKLLNKAKYMQREDCERLPTVKAGEAIKSGAIEENWYCGVCLQFLALKKMKVVKKNIRRQKSGMVGSRSRSSKMDLMSNSEDAAASVSQNASRNNFVDGDDDPTTITEEEDDDDTVLTMLPDCLHFLHQDCAVEYFANLSWNCPICDRGVSAPPKSYS